MLQAKGILTEAEARAITVDASPVEQRDRLAALLHDKGVISDVEFAALHATPASPPLTITTADYKTTPPLPPVTPEPQATPVPVIAAVAPVRLEGIDVPKREGLIPDIKLGSGARIKPYGFFKTSVIHDSSSPQGNDFPLPLLAQDTGPNNSPEFHVRARGLRLGANFEWIDPAPRTTITGKIEFDFEGDFTRVNNRNITSIRSSQPSLRLAWVRIDRRFGDRDSVFALFGQDWSPFVSSTLPNTIENTNFGGIGYGAAYTRIPQAKFGLNHKFGAFVQFQPEIAIVLPAFGDLPTDVANQLAFGERQGADSQQPGVQGRAVLQWQLDKSPNVVPAQLIFSFEHQQRTAIVTAAGVPAAFKAAFPSGAEVSSNSNGYSAEFQLPTHLVTLVGKYYGGDDLRFFLAGQLLSNFNDTFGLTNTASATSIDGASTVVFGLENGVPVVAPQRPVRARGGFVQLGFPLSRIFDANPKGRNAGWTAYLYYGGDEALARDARRFGGRGARSDLFSGNIQYKWNQWVTFAYEEGYYRTRADFRTGPLPLFRGIPSYTTHNIRSEFAAIFTF
ncbi:MAG TPA: hypothetical protein VJ749_07520 [Pyrinomonadaceae bacterium]|nr:hypothetical protein [Pyrinomonadaceae bacterium]